MIRAGDGDTLLNCLVAVLLLSLLAILASLTRNGRELVSL
jgi:type II secretory pathway component PulJ